MDFFGIGPWEILLILIVALMVVGPKKLPEIARTLGKTMRAIKKASGDFTTAVTREIEAEAPPPPKAARTEKLPPALNQIDPPPHQEEAPAPK